ncbi:MAG: ParB/RepB/Spo0J family partition protein [Candidatus Stahlbacteria bacterium]|nr:MAG: ParB/RepB/Spo0J family partition protein [Candidatus Stahlbacteria bacterium]
MAVARKALGKGIDALIPAAPREAKGEALRIPIKLIATNPYQPRKISGQKLSELAASIKEHGMLQPVVVRRKGTSYQLLVGSRRLKAAELAGLAEIPAIIRKATDRQMLALALVENLQREDLNPIEAALAYKQLADEFGMSQEDVAKVVGKDRSTVANTLRLLGLPRKARKLLEEDRITEGHARALLQIASVSLVDKLCDRIVAEGLTVRAVEQIARSAAKVKMPQRRKRKDGIAAAAEELISEKLGIKVRVVRSRKGGKIELRYANEDELNRLLEWFRSR